MEVKIGVQHAPRELVLECGESSQDVAKAVDKALSEGSVFSLTDDRGRRVMVPVDKLAYVEIGEQEVRGVGFTA
ncbi:MAG TPA: DUF3107 domain-containing protein [Candidatus Stackebrandtia faecavium]|nr:DUF3107 domain-containing protein [Candidatus Stackebrandtia faecavium]